MQQTQIDASKDTADLLDELLSPTGSKQVIDINAQASPAVLSGILGINVQQIYSSRQDGKLPPNSDASYRDCIKWYTIFYKTKSQSKASNMGEAALVQKIKLDAAKTEQTWLGIKRERGELVDTAILAERFESHFIHLRMQLCALVRKRPELEKEVDAMLAEWSALGEKMMDKSEETLTTFIQEQLDAEIEVEAGDE